MPENKLLKIFYTLLLLGCTSGMGASRYGIAPKSWYFTVDQRIQDDIQKAFNIKIPAGLYFTDQREAYRRADIRSLSDLSPLIDSTSFDLPSFEGGGQAVIGYSRSGYPTAPEVWLIKANKQRFLLVHKDGQPNRFMGLPRFFVSVKDGVFAFGSDWGIYRRHSNLKDVVMPLTAYTRKFEGEKEVPVLIYNALADKILMAAHPEASKDKGLVNIVVFNLENDSAMPLIHNLQWPFYISHTGIYYTYRDGLFFRPVDWQKETIGDEKVLSRFDPAKDQLDVRRDHFVFHKTNPRGERITYTLDSDGQLSPFTGSVHKFEEVGAREDELMKSMEYEDLLQNLRTGATNPLYSSREVNQFLSGSLGGSRKSWALIIYEEGQMPEHLVSSFIWEMDTGALPASSDLKKLERVYQIDGDRVFDSQDPDEVTSQLNTLLEVAKEKRAVLYLKDFPTTLRSEAQSGNAMKNFQQFWKIFRDCLRDGKCRVVMTMRKEVYGELSKSVEDMLRDAQEKLVPTFDKAKLDEVTRLALTDFEQRHGKRLKDDSIKQFLMFAGRTGRRQHSPGNEIFLLSRLYDFVRAYHPDVAEIDASVMRDWVDRERGVDIVKERLDIEGLRQFLKAKIVGHEKEIDVISDALLPVKNGTHFGKTPQAFFTLVGTPGVGKTFIAKLIADYLTGPNSLLLIDMKEFKGFTPENPVWKSIKASSDQLRVVCFDEVDKVGGAELDRLAAIVEEGRYAEGAENELSFTNTIVIWTANWAQELISDNAVSNTELKVRLRRFLTEPQGDKPPKMADHIWSRIQANILVFRPFSEEQLLKLAFVLCQEEAISLWENKGIRLRVDPLILLNSIAYEAQAQAGARSIRDQLVAGVFSKYAEVLAKDAKHEIEEIVLIQDSRGEIRALSNRDGDAFKTAWDKIKARYSDQEIRTFINLYGVKKIPKTTTPPQKKGSQK